MWIRRLVLNPESLWQDSCFMGIHTSQLVRADWEQGSLSRCTNMQLVLPKNRIRLSNALSCIAWFRAALDL